MSWRRHQRSLPTSSHLRRGYNYTNPRGLRVASHGSQLNCHVPILTLLVFVEQTHRKIMCVNVLGKRHMFGRINGREEKLKPY